MTLTSVHLTNYYHKHSGGISTAYDDLLAAAQRRKRRVCLIVPGVEKEIEDVNEYARIYYIPAKSSLFFDKRYRLIMPWQYMLKPSLIRDIMVDENPAVVEVADKYALSILGAMIRKNYFQKLGRPMLVHLSCERMDDNLSVYALGRAAGNIFADFLIRNYTVPSFDFHIANSNYTASEFTESIVDEKGRDKTGTFSRMAWRFFRSPSVPLKERIHINPVGVDHGRYSPGHKSEAGRIQIAERAGIPADSRILLYAGRISPEKNIGLLVGTMDVLSRREDRDYRLLVAGDGPLADWLRRESDERLGGKVTLLGHQTKDELALHYANADVFVHPNPREPFGLGPLEAMASGTPTVVPNAGGVLSYATAENSWLAEPDASAFADSIEQVFTDTSEQARRVANAITTVQSNSREASTDGLFDAYDRMYKLFVEKRELFVDMAAFPAVRVTDPV